MSITLNGKSNSLNDVSLEETERRRRMDLLSTGPNSGSIVRKTIKDDVIKAEELERERRLAEMGWDEKYHKPQPTLSNAELNELEEEERILNDDITDRIAKLGGMSKKQVIQAEEEERRRRIQEADLISNVYGSPYLSKDAVVKAEESERQRRIAESAFIDEVYAKGTLTPKKLDRIEEAERQRRIAEDKSIDELRTKDSMTWDQLVQAEERERQRRINEDKIIDEVRSRPTMSWKDINDAEEKERARRIYEDEVIDKVWSKPDLSKAEVIALEEKERSRRIELLNTTDRQLTPVPSRSEVVQLEEQERQRRMAEDKLDLEKEKLLSKFDLVAVRKMEEAERQRRIDEDARFDALQEGSRRLAGFQVVAMEELERSRRIQEDKQIDENAHLEQLRNRKLVILAEEEERNRRIADLDRKKHSPDFPLQHVVPAFVPELLSKFQPAQIESIREVPAVSENLSRSVPTSNLNESTTYAGYTPSYSSKRLVAVLGGTGLQGGAVIKALLADGKWSIRTLSRNVNSSESRRLSSLGVEVLQGNMQNELDLARLFAGAYAVFAVTDAADAGSAGKETFIGTSIARSAKSAGVSHFVWSTLPNVETISGGKYRVPHFTDKAKVNSFVRSLNFPFHTFVLPAFYFQNFFSMFAPKYVDGKMEWTFPMTENGYLPAVDINDMGSAVSNILNNPQQWNGSKLRLASEYLRPQDYFINMSLITKITTKVHLLDAHDYSKLAKLSPEFVDMFSFIQEFGFYGKQDHSSYRKAGNQMTSWAQFLQKQRQMVESE